MSNYRWPAESFWKGNRLISRLIGNGFKPIKTETPPRSIRATPTIMCPQCGETPVLAELRHITRGRCWSCHLKD